MKPTAIFLPAIALMLWTLLILLQVPIRRFSAYFSKRVGYFDFQYGESSSVPADVTLPNRVFMNLLEVPVLFYVSLLICYTTNIVSPFLVYLAWAYFFLRVVHGVIYLTYNHIIHRFAVFASSNVVLLALVIYLAASLV